jgi:hypothetical protein
MDIQEIFSTQLTSLPFSAKFTMRSSAGAVLYVAASLTAQQKAGPLGLIVKIDGKQVANPKAFSNEIGSARPLVADLQAIASDFEEHTITLESADSGGIAGAWDFAAATIFYVGMVDPFIWRFSGALPQTKTFQSRISGDGLLFVACSGFTPTAQMAAIEVLLDGQPVAKTHMKPGIANSHFTFPPLFLPIKLTAKQHTIGLAASAGVSTDQNDMFEVAIIY